MKGIQGLIVAVGLGVCAAILNYFYLHNESQKLKMVYFIALKPDKTVVRGERLSADDLEKVGIPEQHVGALPEHAVLYSDRATVDNQPVCRTLSGGALLLQDDIRTPLQDQLELGEGEKAIGIPIDTRTCVPSLIVPGDRVSFLVPVAAAKTPTRAAENANGQENGQLNPIPDAAAAASSGLTRMIGPFNVLSLGNRLSRAEVLRGAKLPQVQENVMMISVGLKSNGQLQDDAQTLWDLVWASGGRGVGVVQYERKGAGR